MKRLIEYARNFIDHPQVLELLKTYCQLNLSYFYSAGNQTLLNRAVACGQEQTVQSLLERGVDCNNSRNLVLEAAENNQWKLYSKYVLLKITPKNIEDLNALMIYAPRAGKNNILTKIIAAIGDDISTVKFAELDMVASAASGGQLETLEYCWQKSVVA